MSLVIQAIRLFITEKFFRHSPYEHMVRWPCKTCRFRVEIEVCFSTWIPFHLKLVTSVFIKPPTLVNHNLGLANTARRHLSPRALQNLVAKSSSKTNH